MSGSADSCFKNQVLKSGIVPIASILAFNINMQSSMGNIFSLDVYPEKVKFYSIGRFQNASNFIVKMFLNKLFVAPLCGYGSV
jgi:hypothetical protein